MPMSFTGMPSSPAIASAMPPFAVPSSFVSTMPSTGTTSENSLAWRRPFWPVVESTVSSVSCGAPGELLVDDAADLAELGHERVLRVQAPGGVDDDDVDAHARGRGGPSRTRPRPGRRPRGRADDLAARALGPARSAARRPRRGTCRPRRAATVWPSSRCRCHASLPIVVVLPVPLTPTAMITVGSRRRSMRSAPSSCGRAMSASSSASRPLSASPPSSSPSPASSSSWPTTRAVVVAPTSAMISASSRRSQVSSSTSP